VSGHPVSLSTYLSIDRHTGEWLKGLAILLMMAHHAFGLPTLIAPENAYTPLIPGIPLEYWIGRFGKICVAIFLLLSGYGFATRAAGGADCSWRYFASKAWRFLLTYWPYFLLAFAIGSLFFQEVMPNGRLRFPTDPAGFALNALTLRNSMAYEWWFAETYLLLVLLARPLVLATKAPVLLLSASLTGFAAGAAMDLAKIDPTDVSFANLLIWQLPFVVGIVAATSAPPQWLRGLFSRNGALVALALTIAGCAVVEIVAAPAMTPFLILAAPLLVFAISQLFGSVSNWATNWLGWLGGLTLGLWLVHPFFCYYFFQDWIYAPQYSPLIFAALLAASLAVVLPVEATRKMLGDLWANRSAG